MFRKTDEMDLHEKYIEVEEVDDSVWICKNCGHKNKGEDSYCIWC